MANEIVEKEKIAANVETVIDVNEEPKHEIAEIKNMDVSTGINMYASTEDFNNAYKMASYLSKSTLIPKAYQSKPTDCMIAIDIANRIGVSPMVVMQNLWVVQGVPSWSGQACMGIIRSCGRYKRVKFIYTGEKGKDTWGCYVSAIEIATGEEIKGAEVTIEMAKKEGWYGKNGSKWQTMPELMLSYRASAFFAKQHCPNELMGFKVEDIAKEAPIKAVDVLGGK